jgi:uncharacterized protein (DUF2141 family)
MKFKWFVCSLILVLLSITLLSQSSEKGTLEIQFTGIRSDTGLIALGIYRSPDGWPHKADIELQWKKENLVDGVLTVKIPDLPFGTLAISVMDDVDGDLEMDYFLGIPREGFGFSMNPKTRLSVPKFEACSFVLDQPLQQIIIKFKYTGKDK